MLLSVRSIIIVVSHVLPSPINPLRERQGIVDMLDRGRRRQRENGGVIHLPVEKSIVLYDAVIVTPQRGRIRFGGEIAPRTSRSVVVDGESPRSVPSHGGGIINRQKGMNVRESINVHRVLAN